MLGIGARVWVQPWLSFSVVEGISYNTDVSLYEKTFRENYTQLLNYLGFEVEAAVSSDLSLVGRIHHRSGAFGTSSTESPKGSNGYLLGLRYRWGQDTPKPESAVMPPLPECEDPDRGQRVKPSSLSERLESIALGDGGDPQRHVSSNKTTQQLSIPPAQQQAMRNEAIAQIDQRISTSLTRAASASNNAAESPFNARIPRSGMKTASAWQSDPSTEEPGKTQLPQWNDQSLESSGLEGLDHDGWLGSRPNGLQQRPLHTGANKD